MKNTLSHWLLLVFIMVCAAIVYRFQAPPAVNENATSESFSALRASEHLKHIAKAPHSGGTPEHQRVREYITAQCRAMGLQVDIQDALGLNQYGSYALSSNVKNIIATLPGRNPQGAILVVSHYDSQPNTFGASDDGAAVVAKLETIRALMEHDQLDHDIIFLFTDQEEVGLLGAEAFASLHPLMDRIKVVLNYESRGNSGLAYCFEVSDENGWIVRQFARAAKHPIANSMAYEVYKLMPNDTDFTVFRRHQLAGLNQANVDGYVHYHSMTDNLENIDLRIVQHHGDNMLSMILHLGNLDLQNTKAPDITFYNPIGSWMIYYPSVLDLPLVLVAILLLILTVVWSFKAQEINWKQLLWGILVFLGSAVVTLIMVTLLTKLLLWINPHYEHFYSNNYYNIHWHILAMIGLWLVTNGLIYRKLWNRIGPRALSLGAFIVLALLMVAVQFTLPTASYLFYTPIIAFMLVNLFVMVRTSTEGQVWTKALAPLVALCLWIPVAVILFVVFSLELPQAGTFLLIMLWAALIPSMEFVERKLQGASYKLGLGLLILGLVVGQLKSSINPEQPLQTALSYIHDFDEGQSSYISTGSLDDWNAQYVDTESQQPFAEYNQDWMVWRGEAPQYQLSPAQVEIKSDTTINGSRQLLFDVLPAGHVTGVRLEFANAIDIQVNGRALAQPVDYLRVAAIDKKLTIKTTVDAGPLSFKLICRSWRLPTSLVTVPLPEDHIFGPGTFSNALFTKQSISL